MSGMSAMHAIRQGRGKVESGNGRDARFPHVADHHRIHRQDVMREPVAHFADQPAAQIEATVVRDFSAHESRDLQHMAMLSRMAVARPEFRGVHPPFLLREMFARMGDPRVECAHERVVRGVARAVEQVKEFGVRGVGDGFAKLEFGG